MVHSIEAKSDMFSKILEVEYNNLLEPARTGTLDPI
jgi:hypothetical protein